MNNNFEDFYEKVGTRLYQLVPTLRISTTMAKLYRFLFSPTVIIFRLYKILNNKY